MFNLSISFVNYNSKQDIIKCLESFSPFLSKSKKVQIFIVNNSQTEFCDDLKKKFPVEIIQMNKNVGFGKGHNAVLPYLDSKYHAVVNPDILFTGQVFEKLMAYLEENLDVGCVSPLIVDSRGQAQDEYRSELNVMDLIFRYIPKPINKLPFISKRRQKHTMKHISRDIPFECDFIQGSFLVMPTRLFKEIHGFDERYFMYAEDADLCKRIRQTHKVVCDPECSVIHRLEEASHRNVKLLGIHCASLFKYFCKWGWRWY